MVIDGEPRMACVTDSRPEAISAETAGHWPAVTVLFSELRCASSPQCFGTAFGHLPEPRLPAPRSIFPRCRCCQKRFEAFIGPRWFIEQRGECGEMI